MGFSGRVQLGSICVLIIVTAACFPELSLLSCGLGALTDADGVAFLRRKLVYILQRALEAATVGDLMDW